MEKKEKKLLAGIVLLLLLTAVIIGFLITERFQRGNGKSRKQRSV